MNTFESNTFTAAQIVGVHIGAPHGLLHAFIPHVFPPNNVIGALLISHILKGALARAELLARVDGVGCKGTLMDCVLMAEVTDADAAVGVIKAELGQTAMGGLFQIAILENAGWRSVHPSAGARVNWLFDTDRHDAAWEESKAATLDFVQLMETICKKCHELAAITSGDEKRQLEEAAAGLEKTALQLRATLAPEQGGEENPS